MPIPPWRTWKHVCSCVLDFCKTSCAARSHNFIRPVFLRSDCVFPSYQISTSSIPIELAGTSFNRAQALRWLTCHRSFSETNGANAQNFASPAELDLGQSDAPLIPRSTSRFATQAPLISCIMRCTLLVVLVLVLVTRQSHCN